MAENEVPAKKNWLKAAGGAVGGLLSGAVVMYATAAFNQVVKPPKPIANFRYTAAGSTLTFENLSGSGQGWWDFGDGAALEPVANRQTVAHTYGRAGDYTVKLSLQNILGEEAERAVTVHVDPTGTSAAGGPPQVAALEAESVSPGAYAPATFKVAGKVLNAQLCLLDYGDERPPEMVVGPAPERLVTFKEPGGHIVKLTAINGLRLDTKTEVVNVEEAPSGTVSVVLTVSDRAVKVESRQRAIELHADSPQSAADGYVITDVSIPVGDGQPLALNGQTELDLDAKACGLKNASNVKLQVLDGGRSVELTGDAGKDWRGRSQPLKVTLVLTEQRQTVVTQSSEMSTTLALPVGTRASSASTALPPVPGDWKNVTRTASLKLLDGDKLLWQGAMPSGPAAFTVGKRCCALSMTAADGKVNFDLRDTSPGVAPAAN